MHFTTALNMVAESKSAMASSTSCDAGFKGVLLAGRRIVQSDRHLPHAIIYAPMLGINRSRRRRRAFGCWTRCERSGVDRPHPALSPRAAAADSAKGGPFCAILRRSYLGGGALDREMAHRVCRSSYGTPRDRMASLCSAASGTLRASGLELSAGECLSRTQSSTYVLLGTRSCRGPFANNRKALAPARARGEG